MSKKYYVTTPIYYVNDVPHIGHAYTTIAADALARFYRMTGHDVFFLTGTDEHGKKVEKSASDYGVQPKELADRVVVRFKELWQKLNISYSRFIRTTDKDHMRAVTHIWKIIYEKGDIYKGVYRDWYCTPCESFWTSSQLVNNKCPDCGRDVELLSEESYFFRLSRYEEPLLRFYEENPDFIKPERRRNEIISFVKQGLKDLSVSRLGLKWGIRVPGDEKHAIYVWFDALTNYLTGAGFPDHRDLFENTWPADVHIIGKDILRFHAVYWPAFLLSAGLPLPRQVYAHGWWTVEGEKMSKSRGNVVDPVIEAERFGVDKFRYFLLREVPFGLDGDYSEASLVHRVNSELSNDIGNLFSRVCGMIKKYRPAGIEISEKNELAEEAQECIREYTSRMQKLDFQGAIGEGLLGLVSRANVYIDRKKPWQMAREQDAGLDGVLAELSEALRIVAYMCYPFMPEAFNKMMEMVGFPEVTDGNPLEWGSIKWKTKIGDLTPIFPRIE